MTGFAFILACGALLLAWIAKAQVNELRRNEKLIMKRLEYLRVRLPAEPPETPVAAAAAAAAAAPAMPQPAPTVPPPVAATPPPAPVMAPPAPMRRPVTPAPVPLRSILEPGLAATPPRPEPKPEPKPEPRREPVPVPAMAATAAAPPVPPKAPPPPPPSRPKEPRRKRDWERWIGTHLLATAGAVFVLLGTSFFVAYGISRGWLTPEIQVALAEIGAVLLGAAALRIWHADDRAKNILGQSLAGAAGGVATLGFVAAARIYDEPVLTPTEALLGTGLAGLFMIGCAVRWRAQITAALGITTALAAPILVKAPANATTATFVVVALVVAGTVVVLRGWPWLAQIGLWVTVPQLYAWLDQYSFDFRQGLAPDGDAWRVALAVGGWWALVVAPSLILEARGGRRLPPVTLLFGASGAATLLGFHVVAATTDHYSFAARLMGAVLIVLHLCAAGLVWRRARLAALLLISLAGAIIALEAMTVFGPAGQTAFWAIEWVALYAIARHERDVQTLIASAGAAILTIGRALWVAPPSVLAYGGRLTEEVALVTIAVILALVGCLYIDRKRDPGWWALGALAAALYAAQAIAVTIGTPHAGTVDQVAQMLGTGALIGVALITIAALHRLSPAFPRHGAALVLGGLIAVKAVFVDIPLDPGSTDVAYGVPLLAAGLFLVALLSGAAARAGAPAAGRPAGIRTLHGWLLPLDRHGGSVPALLLMAVGALTVAPPTVLATGSDAWTDTLIVSAAMLALLASSILVERPRPTTAWWLGTVAAVAYVAQAFTITIVGDPDHVTVEQIAQYAATGVLIAVALATVLVTRRLSPTLPAHGAAFVLAALLAGKALIVDIPLQTTGWDTTVAAPLIAAGLLVLAVAAGRRGTVAAEPGKPGVLHALLHHAFAKLAPLTLPAPAAAVIVVAMLLIAPPVALAIGTTQLGQALVVLGSTLAVLAAAVVIDSRPRPREWWLAAIVPVAMYTAQTVAVTLVTPVAGSWPANQVAQFAGSGAMLGVVLVTVLALRVAAPAFPRHGVAFALGCLIALKVGLIDATSLGRTTTDAAVGTALLVYGLLIVAVAGGRGTVDRHPNGGVFGGVAATARRLSPAIPAVMLAAFVLAVFTGVTAFAVGSDRLTEALPLWLGLFCGLAMLAAWPGRGVRVAITDRAVLRAGRCVESATMGLVAATVLGFLVAMTVVAPHAGTYPVVQRCQVAGTIVLVLGWMAATALGRAGVIARFAGQEPAAIGWLVATEAIVVDVLAFGPHGTSLGPVAAAFLLAGVYGLWLRQPTVPVFGPAQVPAAAALALGGTIVGGWTAAAFGGTDVTRAVIALVAAGVLFLLTARRVSHVVVWRDGTIFAGLFSLVWALSIAVVTALSNTPGGDVAETSAQLGLSLAWATAGIVLIGIGFTGRGEVASVVRKSGIPLLGLAAAKILIWDTRNFSTIQRAMLFVGFGVLLFIGAYFYTRLLKNIQPAGDELADEGPDRGPGVGPHPLPH